jgi:hypothetical protein
MANAMQTAEGRTATTKLYSALWRSGVSHPQAIMLSLRNLAECHNRTMTESLYASYTASLEDLSQQEIILAFSRSHDEDTFWPTPGRLRGLSGRDAPGDPVEREADGAFHALLAKMRTHGWELKPRLGSIIRDRGEDGRLLIEPEREPLIHPGLPARTMQTLAVLGWGDRMQGLALLRDHPGVAKPAMTGEAAEFRVNVLRNADDLRRRWVEAYRLNLATIERKAGRG